MPEYVSQQENVWLKILDVDTSTERAALVQAIKSGDWQSVDALNDQIRSMIQGQPTVEEVMSLTQYYASKKPKLGEADVYEFIGMNVYGADGEYTSILNCRVNGSHVQIRS